MIFDSHAHYDDKQFDHDRESLLGSFLAEKGVVGVINCASTLESIDVTVDLCKEYNYFYGAVGIHPECALALPENYMEIIKNAIDNEKIVAIGECGLDYYYEELCPREKQKEVFVNQIKLAKELDLPVIVHDREAHGDTMDILKEYMPKGVVHCFSGSKEMAMELIKMGFYIGLGGVVTFKNAKHSVSVAEAIPLDRLLLETDAPYLSPVPFRGKRNDSSYISYVASKIGYIRGISATEVLETSRENVKNLFGI